MKQDSHSKHEHSHGGYSHSHDGGGMLAGGHSHTHDADTQDTRTIESPELYHADDEEAERLHFLKVARAYASYSSEHVARFVDRRVYDIKERGKSSLLPQEAKKSKSRSGHSSQRGQGEGQCVSEKHQAMLERFGYFERHERIRSCIEKNQVFLNEVIRDVMHMFQGNNPLSKPNHLDDHNKFSDGDTFLTALSNFSSYPTNRALPNGADYEKIRTTLRQFVRDWSTEGEAERSKSYTPIIAEIESRFGQSEKKQRVHVLVPGAGLARLAFEIAALGFTCQGSEWSVFMLYSSSFILNHTMRAKQFTIYPWATQACNQFSGDKQCRAVQIPDVNPRDILMGQSGQENTFSMSAGDFLEVYRNSEDEWDCIASCFFLDTARNVIEYLELIFKMLKPGGCLINLGPLLYHYTEMPGELSIELTFEELVNVMKEVGFVIEKLDHSQSSPYLDDVNNMLNYNYKTPLLVAVKPATPGITQNEDPPTSKQNHFSTNSASTHSHYRHSAEAS